MITRGKLLWGLGGVIIGAVGTYFVMDYIYESEINRIYAEFSEEAAEKDETIADLDDALMSQKKVLEITDAEMYKPSTKNAVIATSDDDGEMMEAEDAVMSAIQEEEELEEMDPSGIHREQNGLPDEDEPQQEDPDDKDDEVSTVAYDGIGIIDVSEVQPGRRIVAVFNHDNCTLEVARQMSVRNDILDEVIDEDQFEGLLGLEAFNILMNTEPGRRDNMLAIRNNIINLDFVIRYSSK